MPSRRYYWNDDTKDRNVADVLAVNRFEQIIILHVKDKNLRWSEVNQGATGSSKSTH